MNIRDAFESKHEIVVLGYLNPDGYKHHNRVFGSGGGNRSIDYVRNKKSFENSGKEE